MVQNKSSNFSTFSYTFPYTLITYFELHVDNKLLFANSNNCLKTVAAFSSL